jgi:hypothetical protein
VAYLPSPVTTKPRKAGQALALRRLRKTGRPANVPRPRIWLAPVYPRPFAGILGTPGVLFMNEFPAFIRLKISGYELIAFSLADIPRGVEFIVIGRNVKFKKR